MSKPVTITFEDHGQDFLYWEIKGGKVTDCGPFQAWVWVGRKVVTKDLIVSERITIKQPKEHGCGNMTINYPIVAIFQGSLHEFLKSK